MYSEFCCEDDVEYEGPYRTGKEVLQAFEIENVDRTRDMVVLLCYALVLHVLSLVVLQLRYYTFRGKLEKASKAPWREQRAIAAENPATSNAPDYEFDGGGGSPAQSSLIRGESLEAEC